MDVIRMLAAYGLIALYLVVALRWVAKTPY